MDLKIKINYKTMGLKIKKNNKPILLFLAILIIWNDFLPNFIYYIGIIGITLFGFFAYRHSKKIVYNFALGWYFLYFLLMVFECFRGGPAINIIFTLIPTLLEIYIIVITHPDDQDLIDFIQYIAYAGFVLCLYLIIRYHDQLGFYRFGNNLIGTSIINSVGLSNYLICIICAQIWCTFTQNNFWVKIISLFSVIITAILILFTGVRRAIFLALLYVLILVILPNGINVKKRVKIIIMLVIAASMGLYLIITVPGINKILGSRILVFFDSSARQKDFSVRARFDLQFAAINAFLEKPLFGRGYAATRNYFLTTNGLLFNTSHPHNNYLNLMVIGGLPLLFLYYYYPICSLIWLFKQKPPLKSPQFYLLSYCIIVLISDFESSSFNLSVFNFFIGLMIYTKMISKAEKVHHQNDVLQNIYGIDNYKIPQEI